MNRLGITHVVFLIGIVGFCFMTSNYCIAQKETGTLSGTVLDTEGEPISGFVINLSPAFQKSETDEKGAFTFTNVSAGPVQITIPVQPPKQNEKEAPKFRPEYFRPDYEIVSIKIGNITIFQDTHFSSRRVKFGVKSGSHIKNIAVTVQPRMRIRTRVVFKDGKPLKNAQISRVITHQDVGKNGSGRSSGSSTTDSEGYFLHYIQKDDVPAHYTVSVKYKGLSAKSEKILIEEGTRYDDLVLTLDGEAPPSKPTPSETSQEDKAQPTKSTPSTTSQEDKAQLVKPKPRSSPRESLPNILRKLNKTPKKTDKPNVDQQTRPRSPKIMQRPGERNSWVVNPANGHAYKKIRCRSLDDAQKQAAAEGAYLVAINDEAEQKWLLGIFGYHLYWIGLSDAEKEGQWTWQNGEPFTYTNWGDKHRFPRSTLSAEKKDAVIMTFVNGTWHAVGPGDLFWRMTKQALIEKDK